MHNLLKVVFLVLAACLAQSSMADDTTTPAACFAYTLQNATRCRVEAAVAPIENKFFVWGGRDIRGCDQCTRRHSGLSSGGLYDATGRLLEAFPAANGPGPRFGAQALWNRQALFIWGGTRRLMERWDADTAAYVTELTEVASTNSYYIPAIRVWKRLPVLDSPPLMTSSETRADGTVWLVDASKLEIGTSGNVRACWAETSREQEQPARFEYCRTFDMSVDAWGPKVAR